MDKAVATEREIRDLKARAEWNRNWAKLAGNEQERLARLRLAEYFETRARTLAAPDATPPLCP